VILEWILGLKRKRAYDVINFNCHLPAYLDFSQETQTFMHYYYSQQTTNHW